MVYRRLAMNSSRHMINMKLNVSNVYQEFNLALRQAQTHRLMDPSKLSAQQHRGLRLDTLRYIPVLADKNKMETLLGISKGHVSTISCLDFATNVNEQLYDTLDNGQFTMGAFFGDYT